MKKWSGETRFALFLIIGVFSALFMVAHVENSIRESVRAAKVRAIVETYVEHHEPTVPKMVNGEMVMAAAPRSSEWTPVRNAVIAAHPECAICEASGPSANLNVHHKCPFHRCPERELQASNLRTLCRKDHGHVGHACGDGKMNWGLCDNPKLDEAINAERQKRGLAAIDWRRYTAQSQREIDKIKRKPK